MYRRVQHLKILHVDYIPFMSSQNKERLLPYTALSVWFL